MEDERHGHSIPYGVIPVMRQRRCRTICKADLIIID